MLISGTGSTADNVTQSYRCHSRTSSTEINSKPTAGIERSSAPPPSTPPKQQRLSISIKKATLQNQVKESPIQSAIPVHRSPKKSSSDSVISKKRSRKKRRKRKTMDLIPIMEPLYPLKVKIVERMKSPEYAWSRPNGVELLVQAAELASRQNPTPPPDADKTDVVTNSPPPLLPISAISSNSDFVNNNSKPTCQDKEIAEENTPELSVAVEDDAEEDDKLLMVDDGNLNGSGSNGRDSGMANDDEDDDSAGALDLSAKSSRSSPPEESSSKPQGESGKSSSPQFIQQRSTALHSITDSLAHKQRMIQQQQRRLPTPIGHPEAMRNLVTLSQTAALVPPHPQQVATQRLIVASYMHQFAAAAAARAASAPLRPPKPPQSSITHGLLRRPF